MSLRRWIAAAGAALMLSSGLIASAPPVAADHHWKKWGATRAPDQVLKDGCHRYRYHYRIDVKNWAAEIFLVNPNGRTVAHDVIIDVTEPRRAWRRWSTEICRASTTYGRHKIRMKITWSPDPDDPTPDNVEGFVKPSFFRFKRP